MDNSTYSLQKLFSVFTRPQTYLNLIYLFLTFQLGLTYFIMLITGLSLGLGLIIIWVGVLILAAVLALSWACVHFERQMAIHLLKIDIPEPPSTSVPGEPIFQRMNRYLVNPLTWKGLAYLFLKFPLGIATFVICVTLLSLSFSLILAPFLVPFWHLNFFQVRIDSFSLSLMAMVVGIFLTPLSLILLNLVADLWAKITSAMFRTGSKSSSMSAPVSQNS